LSNTPTQYTEFLREYIETFEDLEVTLGVAEHGRTGTNLERLVESVQIDAPTVRGIVERLHRRGVLILADDASGTCVVDWSLPGIAAVLEQLAADYRLNRIRVMSELTANALDRVRTAAIRAFAQAFVIRKDPNG
jgi:hypothetical protein